MNDKYYYDRVNVTQRNKEINDNTPKNFIDVALNLNNSYKNIRDANNYTNNLQNDADKNFDFVNNTLKNLNSTNNQNNNNDNSLNNNIENVLKNSLNSLLNYNNKTYTNNNDYDLNKVKDVNLFKDKDIQDQAFINFNLRSAYSNLLNKLNNSAYDGNLSIAKNLENKAIRNQTLSQINELKPLLNQSQNFINDINLKQTLMNSNENKLNNLLKQQNIDENVINNNIKRDNLFQNNLINNIDNISKISNLLDTNKQKELINNYKLNDYQVTNEDYQNVKDRLLSNNQKIEKYNKTFNNLTAREQNDEISNILKDVQKEKTLNLNQNDFLNFMLKTGNINALQPFLFNKKDNPDYTFKNIDETGNETEIKTKNLNDILNYKKLISSNNNE